MRTLFLVSIFLFSIKALACSCDTPKPAIEFYESDYVFRGKVIKKVYASDSLTKTITFDISKHYKNGDNPKQLEFQFNSEAEVTGLYSSCYFSADVGEEWVVYAKKRDGQLRFHYFCSNSTPLDETEISLSHQKVLDNGNNLDLTDFRYNVHKSKPITNLDSIIRLYQKEKIRSSKKYASLWVDIDRQGNLEKANLSPNKKVVFAETDTIFGMNLLENVDREPTSEVEKKALELTRKIEKWELYYHPKIEKPVKYRIRIAFYVNKDSLIEKWD